MSFVLGVQPRVKPVFGPFTVVEVRAYVIGDKGATVTLAGERSVTWPNGVRSDIPPRATAPQPDPCSY